MIIHRMGERNQNAGDTRHRQFRHVSAPARQITRSALA
jgi:hypothetical protein